MMIEVVVDPDAPASAAVERVAAAVAAGAVAVCPTDTLYGLVANARDADAVDRVFRIKGRDGTRPLPVMAADLDQVGREVGRLTPVGQRLAARWWPGPLTLVIEAHDIVAGGCRGADGSVAVRVPDHRTARAIAARAGTPLTATSANRTGRPAVSRVSELDPLVRVEVDLIVDAGALTGGSPSTIVDVRGTHPQLLRAGAVAWDRVLESLA